MDALELMAYLFKRKTDFMEEQTFTNGGILYVPQITAVQQVIYLDFDGESTIYDGEILTVENVVVQKTSLSEERITSIVDALNKRHLI